MIIKSSHILDENGNFFSGAIRIKDGVFSEVRKNGDIVPEENEEVICYEKEIISPGLVDIHFHGCAGFDFCDGTKEAFDAISEYEEKNGITSIVPATMTLSKERLLEIFSAARAYKNDKGSIIRGINMEGPFVSVKKKGAQNGAYIHKPDVRFFEEMQKKSGGMIKQVAIAPEEDESRQVIKELAKEVVVSVAHTTASYDIADEAFAAGANHVTHLFNAMPGFLHREPGVVGAAFDHKEVYVELICDGIHVHPSMMRAMFKLFGAQRICVISDSMMATGMEDGNYALGGQAVKVTGRRATLEDGTIAGSVSNLMDCVRVLVTDAKIPLGEALMSASIIPARSLKIDDRCGSISEGKDAQLVVLSKDLEIIKVINRKK